ncbi:MAG: helix-turn-helix transcriptional regulator [Burkholderiaceae bacterium]
MIGQESPRDDRSSLYTVIDNLHAAFCDGACWPEFLASLSVVVGARAAAMISLAPVERTGLLVAHGISASTMTRWQSHYQEIDPWLSTLSMPGPGKLFVYRGTDLAGNSDVRSRFALEFLDPNGLGPHIGAWITPADPLTSPYALLLWRAPHAPNFEQRHIDSLSLVSRSIAAQEQISIANSLSRASGLSDQQSAVYLLNDNGSVLVTNRRGAELVDRELVRYPGRSLGFASSGANAWLQAILASIQRSPGIVDHPIEQREKMAGLGTVNLSFYPLQAIGNAPSLLGVRYGLTLRESNARAEVNLSRIANKMYRWTSAELDTVRRLAEGDAVPDIARERACSIETVRSHLKNAKRKAGVNRQVELVRVMMLLEGTGGN